jgi:Predicted sulfurtransferase
MTTLYNKISNKELKERLAQDTEPRTTISFYKYFNIANPQEFRDELYEKFDDLGVFGRVYIAQEGINAQISVPTANLDKFKDTLYAMDQALDGIRLNYALDDDGKSFWVLRMKVRDKVVADGIDDPTFDPSDVGAYLKASEVNEMMNRDDTIFVDMRNHYEYEVGHFKDALEVPSTTFREQLPMAVDMLKDDKDKNIVMYCTGGIRCEKASAYMKHEGFENVYHVEGGIIEYTRKAEEEGLPVEFIGKNFVFDERMGERITDDVLSTCPQCGKPSDNHKNCYNQACHRLFIQCPECEEKYEGCCSEECLEEKHLPKDEVKKLIQERAQDEAFFTKGRG